MYEEQGDRENLRKALAVYEEGLARLPNDSSLRQHVARALVRLDRLPEALAHLTRLVEQDPADQEAWPRKGLVHLELEQWQAAAAAFERLLPMARDRGPIHYYLGLALERLEDIPGAVKEFRQVPESSDLYGDARLHAAFLFQEMRRQPEAIQMLEPAVRADKASVDATLYLGGLYVEVGDFARALQVYQRAAQTFPGNTKVLFRIGALLERMGMRDQAEKTFYDLLEVDPDHAEALNYLAYLYAEENVRLEEALAMARRAVALKEAGHILDTLGWVLYRLERYEESRAHLEKAHALLPDDPVILEHLGDVYQRLGMKEAAVEAYRRSLESAPDQGSVKDKLQELAP